MAIKSEKWLIWLIFLLAFLIRVWGITFGTPGYNLGCDEFRVMNSVVKIAVTKNPDPIFLNYPSFWFYMQVLWLSLCWLFGRVAGIFGSYNEFFMSFYVDTTNFLVCARLLVALLGALTVVFVYKAVRNVLNRNMAFFGAVVASFAFTHVRFSHWAITDVPATFFITLTIYFSTMMLKQKSGKNWHLLAGLASGLAAATKYNGGLVLLVPIAALWTLSEGKGINRIKNLWKDKRFRWLIRIAFMSFLIATPYVVLTPVRFLKNFGYEVYHMRTGHLGFENLPPGWIYHGLVSIPQAVGVIAIVLAVFGLVAVVRRREWYLAVFPVVYFFMIGSWKVLFQRYTVPIYPSLAILSAYGANIVCGLFGKWREKMVILLLLITVAFPAVKSIRYDYLTTKPSTINLFSEFTCKMKCDKCFCSPAQEFKYILHLANVGDSDWDRYVRKYVKKYMEGNIVWTNLQYMPNNFLIREYKNSGCEFIVDFDTRTSRILVASNRFPIQARFWAEVRKLPVVKVFRGQKWDPIREFSIKELFSIKHLGTTIFVRKLK